MKKIVQITVLFAVACSLFIGCKKNEDGTGGVKNKNKLSILIDKASIEVGKETTITVKSEVPLTETLVVDITLDNAFIQAPKVILIEKGKDAATATIKGLSSGVTKITISVKDADVEYLVQTVGVVVNKPNKQGSFGKMAASAMLNPPTIVFANLSCESEQYGKVYPGALYYHDGDVLGGTPTGIYKSSIDVYGGSAVGKIVGGEVFFTSIPEGTVIDSNLPWHNYYTTYMRFPIIVKNGDVVNSIADGTHFIVVGLPVAGDPNNTGGFESAIYMPCWLKIEVRGMSINVLDGAMVLDEKTPFTVGQKS